MSVVFILVFVAILLAGGFLAAFVWAVRSGQYEDTYTPSVRILFDDMVKKKESEGASQTSGTGNSEAEMEESLSLQSQFTVSIGRESETRNK